MIYLYNGMTFEGATLVYRSDSNAEGGWHADDSNTKPGDRCNIEMSSYQYRDPHVKTYKNPQHLDVVDRYLRRIGDKTIPDEALPSMDSFCPPWVAVIDLPQSRCCGFFVLFINKQKWRCIVS